MAPTAGAFAENKWKLLMSDDITGMPLRELVRNVTPSTVREVFLLQGPAREMTLPGSLWVKDREAWRAAVHGVAKSGTQLSD